MTRLPSRQRDRRMPRFLRRAPRRRTLAQISMAALLVLAGAGTYSAWTAGAGNGVSSLATVAAYEPPSIGQVPQISGTPRHGDVLTAGLGTWSGPGEPFTYQRQWLRCNASGTSCTNVFGATGPTYTPTATDVTSGRTIRVRVTATSAYGQTAAESQPTSVVLARPVEMVSAPSLAPTARETDLLRPEPGTWEGTDVQFSHQWLVCDEWGGDCTEIPDATEPEYVVSRRYEGLTFRVLITAFNTSLPGGTEVVWESDATEPVTVLPDTGASRYTPDGYVHSIARHDGKTFIGGDFSHVGLPTGAFAQVGIASGEASLAIPTVTGGEVRAVEPDGAGGWFIGGSFTSVGTVTRSRLAHILPSGALDLAWNPSANGVVHDLELAGTTLYAGGQFTTLSGQARSYAGALGAATGAVLAWNPNVGPAGSQVLTVHATPSSVFLGGSFTTVAGVARSRVAAVDPGTAALQPFAPALNGVVHAIEMSGSTLYVGGAFTLVGTVSRSGAVAFDTTTGAHTSWNPTVVGTVHTVLPTAATIFLGGSFSTVRGVSRPNLIGVNTTTGVPNWVPGVPSGTFAGSGSTTVRTLAADGAALYAGGDFTAIGASARRGLAAISLATANLTSWTAESSTPIFASGIADGSLYAGGGQAASPRMMLMNAVPRQNLAAFDADGEIDPFWSPAPDAPVSAMAAHDGVLYFGGAFADVSGHARAGLAAANTEWGDVEDWWNPGADGAITDMEVAGETLYVSGGFTTVGGVARNRVASFQDMSMFNEGSDVPTSWAPQPNSSVQTIEVARDGTVYLGGEFTAFGAVARNALAAFEPDTSTPTAWNPTPNGGVWTLYVSPNETVYAGGVFNFVGAQPRSYLAAFDRDTSTPNDWAPSPDNLVWRLEGWGDTVWAAGFFSTIGGESRSVIAGIDALDGSVSSWAPAFDSIPAALLADGSGLHVGGYFQFAGTEAKPGYVRFE